MINERIEAVLAVAIFLIPSILFIYLVACFVAWNFNPEYWSEPLRFVVAIVTGVWSAAVAKVACDGSGK